MNRIAVFIIVLLLLCAGCANAPHPLLRAFAPSNFGANLAASVTIDARLVAIADIGFLPLSYVSAETRGNRILIRIRPPYNTREMRDYYKAELAKRGYDNVDFEEEPQKEGVR